MGISGTIHWDDWLNPYHIGARDCYAAGRVVIESLFKRCICPAHSTTLRAHSIYSILRRTDQSGVGLKDERR
jgi:hypothetical protein